MHVSYLSTKLAVLSSTDQSPLFSLIFVKHTISVSSGSFLHVTKHPQYSFIHVSYPRHQQNIADFVILVKLITGYRYRNNLLDLKIMIPALSRLRLGICYMYLLKCLYCHVIYNYIGVINLARLLQDGGKLLSCKAFFFLSTSNLCSLEIPLLKYSSFFRVS